MEIHCALVAPADQRAFAFAQIVSNKLNSISLITSLAMKRKGADDAAFTLFSQKLVLHLRGARRERVAKGHIHGNAHVFPLGASHTQREPRTQI